MMQRSIEQVFMSALMERGSLQMRMSEAIQSVGA